jgi:hypothetical protein
MSDAESRYYDALDDAGHVHNCGLCLIGRGDLCTDSEDDNDDD